MSDEPRITSTRCILNPRLEPVITELSERINNDFPLAVRELAIATKQDLGDEETIFVPSLTLLDGGLTEGTFRRFNKRIIAPDKKFNSTINLTELLDDYYTLFTFDKKIAEYLVINEIKIVDYTAFGKVSKPDLRIRELQVKRISGRRLKGTPLMENSKITDKGKCLEIPLDAYALREYYEGAQWKYIGTYFAIDPIDLPTLLPAIFDTPDKDELFAQRTCYIPPSDPSYKAMCFEGVKKDFEWRRKPPVDVRELKEKSSEAEEHGEEEE